MSKELWKLSAVKMAEGIRNREFSCEEVVNSVTNRIQKLNPSLNAVVGDLNPTAVDEARRADRELETGKATGPLHGVPVTVKCNVDVEGQTTSNGLPAFADLIAREDSPVVSLLKKAGVIIIGRSNTPELSMRMNTDNPLFGRTFNPWDEQQVPGALPGAPPLLRQQDSARFITETILAVPYAILHTTAVWRRSNRHSAGFRPGFLRLRRNGACCPS